MRAPNPAGWEAVGRELRLYPSHSLWRTYCDRLNRQWLTGLLGRSSFDAALKTDAFDEAVGEGVYQVLRGAARKGYLMDVSPSTCSQAAARCGGLAAAACDIRRLPFREESLDLVISLSTLDHFSSVVEIEQALRSIYRVLRPGGRLLLTLDNLSNPLVRLRNSVPARLLEKTGLVPFPVGVTLCSRQLRGLLERVGYRVESLGTLMHVPRAPAVAWAGLLDRWNWASARGASCRAFLALEFLSRLPTARWTGNYIAAACSKGGGASSSP
ncbi:MAG: class I SAM-dependent methyltransferase [Bryobacterales bacterium]|jgi:SAM-dependent methyltransferase|nr:class I SAM-dependent methyltransferase [Bryobacterales bacterium]